MQNLILTSFSLDELEQTLEKVVKRLLPTEQNPAKSNKEIRAEPLTLEETAKFLKITKPTLHNWIKKGRLTPTRIDGRVLIMPSEIDKCLKNNTQISLIK